MLSYYISQSNEFVIRTRNTGSNDVFTLKLEDMMTYATSSYTIPTSSYNFNPYENILTFSQSLEGSVETGQEYLVEISGSNSGSIYFGSMQVYASQSIDKPNYVTQNDKFISNVTDNEYIVL
jgi:hypothetical protein